MGFFIGNFIAKIADRPIRRRMIQRLRLGDLSGPRSQDFLPTISPFLKELNPENPENA